MHLLTIALAALLSTPAARAQDFEPIEGLEWSWAPGESHQWYVEAEIHLPGFIWFAAEHNKEARVVSYQVRMLTTCEPALENKKGWELACVIDDIGLKAATLSPDQPQLPEILDELDTKLTGAPLQLELRKDGRLRSLDLEGMEKENLRTGRIQENTRLVLYRAMAGFDLQLPRKGYARYPSWAQTDSVLMWSPSAVGTLGSTEFVHQIIERKGDLVIVQTLGRGMVVPAAQANQYDTDLDAMAVFDLKQGVLTERVWNALGKPTASSVVAEGGKGLVYRQQGKITLVSGDAPEVGTSEMVALPGLSDPGLPAWQPLGLIPEPVAPPPGVE